MKIKSLLLSLAFLPTMAEAQEYELPTMGWSSWNTYWSNISESLIKRQADAMVSAGYKAAGYKYINIDDGYQGGRNKETGELLIHPTRFPNGLKVVSDYIHKKGLKAGIYSDGGKNTCANYHGGDVLSVDVGMYRYDERDAKFFFDTLDFDFIKVDFCGGDPIHNAERLDLDEQERYTAIHNAILKCEKKDVRLNVCRWAFPGTWVHDVATSWRTTGDINASWESVRNILAENLYLSAYCSEGHYNDMDMLEVGKGLSTEEDKTHFGMWCIMDSPLLIGCDMTNVSTTAASLMKNKELIALNQDPLCLQAYVISKQNGCYILAKDIEQLYGKTRAVALYNPTDQSQEMTLTFGDADLGGVVKVRDCFAKKDLADQKGQMKVTVPAHGTRIYKLTAEKRYERDLYEAETAYLSKYSEIEGNWGRYEDNSNASGGEIASWLGSFPENDLRWRHVYSKEGGEYTMTLSYLSGENRKTCVSVNGEKVLTKDLNSGSFGTIKTLNIDITLKAGENEVRIYTEGTNWLPNFDCMTLSRKAGGEADEKKLEVLTCQLEEAKEKALTAAVKGQIEDLLQQASATEMDATTLNNLVTEMQKALTTAGSIEKSCNDFKLWMDNAQLNTEASEANTALTELQEKMNSAQTAYDEATTTTKVNAALTTLKNALKTYLKSDEAHPLEGKTLDMTLLLNNPDLSASSGWSGSPTYSNGIGEIYNKTFNVYQTLSSMKPGVYEISAQALYRTGENDGGTLYAAKKEVIPARFYANLDSVAVPSLYKYKFSTTVAANYSETDIKNYYANSTKTAATAFASKRYTCKLRTTLEEKGNLRIGFVTKQHDNDSWFAFDALNIQYSSLPQEDAILSPTPNHNGDAPLYDLSGRKVTHPTQNGVYIKKGKKVVKP